MAKESHSGGIGFSGLLTIVFIVLKILGKITWSWWWVFCPLWIPLVILFAFLLLCFVGFIIKEIL